MMNLEELMEKKGLPMVDNVKTVKKAKYTQKEINDLVIKMAVRLGLIEEDVVPIKNIAK